MLPTNYWLTNHMYRQDSSLNNLEGGAHGVMVIVVGNGHGNTSSNPGRD